MTLIGVATLLLLAQPAAARPRAEQVRFTTGVATTLTGTGCAPATVSHPLADAAVVLPGGHVGRAPMPLDIGG